jgi:hypothetical protein
MYSVNDKGQLVLTILRDNNDVDYLLIAGEIFVLDEITGEREGV